MPLNEYEFPTSKLSNVQSQLEKLVEKNYYLHQSAKEAFRLVVCRLPGAECPTGAATWVLPYLQVVHACLQLAPPEGHVQHPFAGPEGRSQELWFLYTSSSFHSIGKQGSPYPQSSEKRARGRLPPIKIWCVLLVS